MSFNKKINKYLDERGNYNPILSENIRQVYKDSKIKKETPLKKLDHNPISRFINRLFRILHKKI